MGATIKRQPITYSIPKDPDYKFLNITDFSGLNMTDNPFLANNNTASDLLNVYVDEHNALTTRPRLEAKYNFKNLLGFSNNDVFELISVYSLNEGYLIHYKLNDTYVMKIMKNYLLTNITSAIPNSVCKTFEQDNKIYLLTGSDYKVIENNVVKDVEGYVPTYRESGTNNTLGTKYDNLNLLSNKYKETYTWDGTWDLNLIKTSSSDVIENKTLSQTKMYKSGGYKMIKYMSDNDANLKEQWLVKTNTRLYKYEFDKLSDGPNTGTTVQYPLPAAVPTYERIYGDCSYDGSTVAMCFVNADTLVDDSNLSSGALYVYKNSKFYMLSGSDKKYRFIEPYEDDENNFRVRVNNDGSLIVCYSSRNIMIYKYDSVNDSFVETLFPFVTNTTISSSDYQCIGIDISESGNTVICKMKQRTSSFTNSFERLYYIKNIDPTHTQTGLTLNYFEDSTGNGFCNTTVSQNGVYLYLDIYNGEGRLYSNFTTDNTYSIITHQIGVGTRTAQFKFSNSNDKLYYYWSNAQGWIILSTNTQIPYTFIEDRSSIDVVEGMISYATSNIWYMPFKDNAISDYYYVYRNTITFTDKEPLITITKTLKTSDDEYQEWLSQREKFFNSYINTRFDNERWFASGNQIFTTINNDPTRIEQLNTLGDDGDITGFNLVQDNTLVAYKKDRLWAIGIGENDYTWQETKNTVGNEVNDATIVSCYSEMPLQVSKSGIYALNQLKNVQSSDRISVSISDFISKKWLKEDDVSKCKTTNWLYWTLFTIPKIGFTSIYLLDNRKLTWYYWELPIVVKDIFVKNDVVELTDNKKMYHLKTTDIIIDDDLTEYYDDGRKLIKWFWKSQILNLGTINYSKKLLNTTFILTDTDENDKYGLSYTFRAYRRLVSETDLNTISDDLNYVASVTKNTLITRFKFLQFNLSNMDEDEDDAYNNNKLRLIGMGLKYVLLEGMN